MRFVIFMVTFLVLSKYGICQLESSEDRVSKLIDSLKSKEPPVFSYTELASKADLVVIASVLDLRKVELNYGNTTDFDKTTIERVAYRLNIKSRLKGESDDQIEMVSTRWGPHVIAIGSHTRFAKLYLRISSPNLVEVVLGDEITHMGSIDDAKAEFVVPEYLL